MLRIPVATYRIQFSLDFRFSDARDLVPYLSELGITDLYASPRFKARKGSSHGYDVADPRYVNSELGTEREFEELTNKLKHYSMGLLLDIVPNHMSASDENPWWMDVLENGPSSKYAEYFDIDWHPATTKAAFLQENRVLLPVLGDLYGNVLENGELTLRLDEAGFFVKYYEHRFPLDPKTYEPLIRQIEEECRNAPDLDAEAQKGISEILGEIEKLPQYSEAGPETREERATRSKLIKGRVWELYHSVPSVRRATDEIIRRINGSRETPSSLLQLDQILSAQPYRLAYWKIGLEEINYRRFFDVNELVGVRVEDPRVFADRHRGILRLIGEGKVTGLRVDHIDGLYDPLTYLERLQHSIPPDGRSSPPEVYVVVEKILGEREHLPENWPVSGTSGYDFLNAVNLVFVDAKGLDALQRTYEQILGSSVSFSDASYAGNKLVMDALFAGEIQSLGHHLGRLAAQHRHARDLPMSELIQVLKEVTACLPVYRTYINGTPVSERDRGFLDHALTLARQRVSAGALCDSAFSFLRQVLFLEPPDYAADLLDEYLRFVMRWQQFTGPVMAKGVEDTAFYVHHSLISLNEVGGDPTREFLPLGVGEFHQFNQYRQSHWPHSLNTTSTHDTKRGEDVRARVNVLSELPGEWNRCFRRWHQWNAPHRKLVSGHTVPQISEEALLYQTMLGAWPIDVEDVPEFHIRLKGFAVKAAREAKVCTDWLNPDPEHESALVGFVDSIFKPSAKSQFFSDFLSLQKKVAFYGFLNSLSQTLLKITSPGVPDLYQGGELWDFNLVDPDNRRPVDFHVRARLFDEIKELEHQDKGRLRKELLSHWKDGRIKLYLTWRALNFRRKYKEVFAHGNYVPLSVAGKFRDSLCAFALRHEEDWVAVIVPRFLSRVVRPGKLPLGKDVWGTSAIRLPAESPSGWQNILTGEQVRPFTSGGQPAFHVSELFRTFPVALCSSAPL